jgi:hypothetical protein
MSPVERTMQMIFFGGAVVGFWYGIVPLTLGTIEWIFNIDGRRR